MIHRPTLSRPLLSAPAPGDQASWCDPTEPRIARSRGNTGLGAARPAWEHFVNKSRRLMMWRNSDPIRPPLRSGTAAGTTGQRRRLTTGQRLAQALFDRAGPLARLVRHGETQWSSATFSGSRHTLVIHFAGHDAVEDAETLMTAITEDAITIPGALIAELTVSAFTQTLLPHPEAEMTVTALLLDQ